MDRDVQFIGQSGAFLDAVERTSRAAPLRRPVLVIGERGTGKELIAERLHQLSKRWAEPLITLNCAALPETLIEAELFGHEAGAFTGATRARAGRFEEADQGTLFLDELATLSMGAQERLLRAVEYGEVTRIGASKPIRVDVRIVAATNEDLPRLAEEGKFRSDLLDRLSFEVITLPPLRVREGDIRVLTEYFGRHMASVFDPFDSPWKPSPVFAADSGRPAGIPSGQPLAPAPSVHLDSINNLKAAVDAHEKAIVEQALNRHRYNQRQTAKALGLTYDQLRHCMKKHGLMERGG